MTAAKSDQAPVLVWFRDDRRMSDHPALHAAAKTGAPLIGLYVLDERDALPRPPGGAARWWLAGSLRALAADLARHDVPLILRRGDVSKLVPAVARQAGAQALHFNAVATVPDRAIEDDIAQACEADGIEVVRSAPDLLAPPEAIRSKEGRGLRVFTPFFKRLQGLPIAKPLPAPRKLRGGDASVKSDDLADWKLEPTKPDWAGGMRERWIPGEAGAHAALDDFLERSAKGYATNRDRMDRAGTSHLSPHLRHGEISPRQIWHAAEFAADTHPPRASDLAKFRSELAWREFCRHLLFDVPNLHEQPLNAKFADLPWRSDAKALRAWQRGETGYPIVDAGMRELWITGVMHNRVRMVAASFLIKHLLIDWREGERWFWDTLVDADPGSNPANWQWVAGCGADAAPFFRIFNPVLQGEKFDPDGDYVRRWVPELKALPAKIIHQPWTATPMELREAGITLGTDYPEPIVDHAMARKRALEALAKIRS